MGKGFKVVVLIIMIGCFFMAMGCGPKKAVGLKQVFNTCALQATLDELGVLDSSVKDKEGYLEYVEERLFEEKERNRYSKTVWKRMVKRTQQAAEKKWDETYAQKKNECVANKGFIEKDEIE